MNYYVVHYTYKIGTTIGKRSKYFITYKAATIFKASLKIWFSNIRLQIKHMK